MEQLEKYTKEINGQQMDEYMKMNEQTNETIESYVDMTANNEITNQFVKDINEDKHCMNANHYQYDDIKNVRSIYENTPVPTEPMEVVPMIHLW